MVMTTDDVRLLLREWAQTIPNGPFVGELYGMARSMDERELTGFLRAFETIEAQRARERHDPYDAIHREQLARPGLRPNSRRCNCFANGIAPEFCAHR